MLTNDSARAQGNGQAESGTYSSKSKAALKRLHAAGAHLVLTKGKRPVAKGWQRTPATLEAVIEHASKGGDNQIGLVPASLGLLALDFDIDGEALRDAIREVEAAFGPALGGQRTASGRAHLFYRAADGRGGNRTWAYGDVRQSAGQIIAYAPDRIAAMLPVADGPPFPLQAFLKRFPKAKAKAKAGGEEDGRHNTIRDKAFAAGQANDKEAYEAALKEALAMGGDKADTRRTARDAWKAGRAAARRKLASGLDELSLAAGFLDAAAGRFQILAPGEPLFWMDGTGWQSGDGATLAARDAMRKLVEHRARVEGDDAATARNLARAGSYARIAGALKLAERPAVFTARDDWNADPEALGLPRCSRADLVSGQEREATPADRITMRTSCLPDATCPAPRLHEVLDHMSGGDDELQLFYQLVLGGSLIGGTGFEKIFVWVGEGGSGKSTLLSACKKAAGDYGGAVDRSTLEGGDGQHRTFLEALVGKRLVVSNELRARQLNVEVLKSMSGGDETPVNKMRENPRNARIDATFHCQGNPASLPTVAIVDSSVRRRFVVVPAGKSVEIHKQNPAVKRELMGKEQPAVLAWMMQGARAAALMQASGQWAMPKVVETATEKWLAEASPLGRFIAECCETGPELFEEFGIIYMRFREWHKDAGLRSAMPSTTAFGRALTDAKYPSVQRRVRREHGGKTVMVNAKVRLGLRAHGGFF